MAEIYFAGGCFWGVEHFFKGVDGVSSAVPGYANGLTENPSYKEVYTDKTGFAETVRVVYNPSRVSLSRLVKFFFAIIDPLSLNRQGHDEGTRYRTGVFYTDDSDLPVLESEFALVSAELGQAPVTELCPLRNFYPAEDYHQDYLDKNPSGYCHLPLKVFRYLRLFQDIELFLGPEPDPIARMANMAALIHHRMHFFWTGFYLVQERPAADGKSGNAVPVGATTHARDSGRDMPASATIPARDSGRNMPASATMHARDSGRDMPASATIPARELVLGPFQGPEACFRIGFGKGVCGTAWAQGRTLVVPDVEQFPGHIACSSLSRSEIVVPFRRHPTCTSSVSPASQASANPDFSIAVDPRHSRPDRESPAAPTSQAPVGIIGVLDIDSAELDTFDSFDAAWLGLITTLM